MQSCAKGGFAFRLQSDSQALGFDPVGLPWESYLVLGEFLPEFIFWAQVPCLSIFLCILYLSEQNSGSLRV